MYGFLVRFNFDNISIFSQMFKTIYFHITTLKKKVFCFIIFFSTFLLFKGKYSILSNSTVGRSCTNKTFKDFQTYNDHNNQIPSISLIEKPLLYVLKEDTRNPCTG